MKRRGFNLALQKSQSVQNETVYELYIYDDIQKYGKFNWSTFTYDDAETSAKHIRDCLAEIPDDAKIIIYINSNGGAVDQATAISSQLRRHPGEVTAVVDGSCHSAAFTILQAADKRIMNPGTTAIIHNMLTYACGNANELRTIADQLDNAMNACIDVYMERTKNLTREELVKMLDAETELTPEMALNYGFIDEITERHPDNEVRENVEVDKDDEDDKKEQVHIEPDMMKSILEKLNKVIELNRPEEKKEQIEKGAGFNAFFNN